MRRTAFSSLAIGVTIVAVALLLSACAKTLQLAADVTGVDVVSESVRQKAYKAALITFVAWGGAPPAECLTKPPTLPAEQCIGGVQALIYRYGRLTPCQNTTSLLCRDDQAWAKVQSIELATTNALAATEPIIMAGTDDVELLLSLPTVVNDAKAAVEKAMRGE